MLWVGASLVIILRQVVAQILLGGYGNRGLGTKFQITGGLGLRTVLGRARGVHVSEGNGTMARIVPGFDEQLIHRYQVALEDRS